MSRSNTNYYNICKRDEVTGKCVRDGMFHRSCYFEGEYVTRRGVFRRKRRFPEWSVKSYHSTPPVSIKQCWIKRARAKQQHEMRKEAEDPIVTPMRRLIDPWDWY